MEIDIDYLYIKVEEVANQLIDYGTDKQRAFGSHLLNVSDALRATQKVISGDYAQGQEIKFINKCLNKENGKSKKIQ
jgi:hypothetical protein